MTTIPHIQYLLQDFFVIPAVRHDLAADQFHAPAEAETAFCCLISGADFSVIEHVFLSHRNRRKIRHHDICAGFYAEFTSNVHEVTPEYLADIESEKPLRQTLARELWLQTEHLWAQFPGFIEALRNH